jgi:transposase
LGIDPYAYLKDVLTRLPRMTNRQIPEVTPQAWAKAHLQAPQQAAS